MFHASADVPRAYGVFHGDAPSRGQHRPGDFIDRNSPNNPSLSSNRGPNPNSLSNPGNLNAPSNRSNRSNRNNPSSRSPSDLSNQ